MTAPSLDPDDPPSSATVDGALPLRQLFSLLGEKWTLPVLITLSRERRRFSELKRGIPGVSQRMLAQTLRALERARLLDRVVLSSMPPRVEYAITELGQGLFPHLQALRGWVGSHERELFGSAAQAAMPPLPAAR